MKTYYRTKDLNGEVRDFYSIWIELGVDSYNGEFFYYVWGDYRDCYFSVMKSIVLEAFPVSQYPPEKMVKIVEDLKASCAVQVDVEAGA